MIHVLKKYVYIYTHIYIHTHILLFHGPVYGNDTPQLPRSKGVMDGNWQVLIILTDPKEMSEIRFDILNFGIYTNTLDF